MWLAALKLAAAAAAAGASQHALEPRAYEPIELRDITPHSWALTQLKIQANGLSGVLDIFWPEVHGMWWP